MKKTVLITGASRGLGHCLAEEFRSLGFDFDVILHSKEQEITVAHNDQIVKAVIKGDLQFKSTTTRLVEATEKNDIDILINNAGIYCQGSLKETSIDAYWEIIKVNLMAQINLIKSIWPIFVKKQSGLIININSTAGKYGSNGESAYCASKHGLRGFSSSLRREAGENGIRIIDVYLGAMKTDMSKHRQDWDNLIEPTEAARVIVGLCENYESLNVSEITIARMKY